MFGVKSGLWTTFCKATSANCLSTLHCSYRATETYRQQLRLRLQDSDFVAGEHEHTIVGYSLVKGIGDGEPIASERFTVGGHEWVCTFSLWFCVANFAVPLSTLPPEEQTASVDNSKFLCPIEHHPNRKT